MAPKPELPPKRRRRPKRRRGRRSKPSLRKKNSTIWPLRRRKNWDTKLWLRSHMNWNRARKRNIESSTRKTWLTLRTSKVRPKSTSRPMNTLSTWAETRSRLSRSPNPRKLPRRRLRRFQKTSKRKRTIKRLLMMTLKAFKPFMTKKTRRKAISTARLRSYTQRSPRNRRLKTKQTVHRRLKPCTL